MQRKLWVASELIREATVENKNLKDELESLYLEVDRLRLQLEQKKTQLALTQEKKAENELRMKKQIKDLLQACLSSSTAAQSETFIENEQETQFMEFMTRDDYGLPEEFSQSQYQGGHPSQMMTR